MTNLNADGGVAGQSKPSSEDVHPLNNVTVDIVDVLTTVATPTAIAAGIKYGLQSWDNHVTQQAETRREQIRQDGETARAVITAQIPAPTDDPA
jgi:hypothetical protein